MNLLQIFLSLLKNNKSLEQFLPLLSILQQNNFDLQKTLASIDPKALQPLITSLMNFFENKSPTYSVGQENALSPISDIADKDIIYSLNKYLSQDSVSL